MHPIRPTAPNNNPDAAIDRGNMLDLLLVVIGWGLGWALFGHPRILTGKSPRTPEPVSDIAGTSVSIVIPARNESRSLPLLLDDLARARPAGSEVIVVDDESTDDTVSIAGRYDFVTVLDASDRPDGWVGKTWACHVGARAAASDTLCFIDADVRVEPGGLEALADELGTRGGLVSVHPWHDVEHPYEHASALFGVVSLMGIGAGRSGDAHGAFGPVLMTDRADYDLTGGHLAVRSEVVEDMALARRYQRADRSVSVFTGGRAIRYRMYPDGPASLVQGWTKNFASGASATGFVRLLAAAAWLAAMGTTILMAADVLAGTRSGLLVAALYVAFVVQMRSMFRATGRFSTGTALLYPLWLVVFLAVFFRSMWFTVVRREVQWRGRVVPIRSASAL